MARYPEKDPRVYPFTGFVPPVADAEAKEARFNQLNEDIINNRCRLMRMMPILVGPRKYLEGHIKKLEVERDALLASIETE